MGQIFEIPEKLWRKLSHLIPYLPAEALIRLPSLLSGRLEGVTWITVVGGADLGADPGDIGFSNAPATAGD